MSEPVLVLTYELTKFTQLKAMYTQALPYHEDLIHSAEIPYLYMSKKEFYRRGRPQIIEVRVTNADSKYAEG